MKLFCNILEIYLPMAFNSILYILRNYSFLCIEFIAIIYIFVTLNCKNENL